MLPPTTTNHNNKTSHAMKYHSHLDRIRCPHCDEFISNDEDPIAVTLWGSQDTPHPRRMRLVQQDLLHPRTGHPHLVYL